MSDKNVLCENDKLKCKNDKLRRLIAQKPNLNNKNDYNVPVVNLSSQELDVDVSKFGLHHSFTDKKNMLKEILQLNLSHYLMF